MQGLEGPRACHGNLQVPPKRLRVRVHCQCPDIIWDRFLVQALVRVANPHIRPAPRVVGLEAYRFPISLHGLLAVRAIRLRRPQLVPKAVVVLLQAQRVLESLLRLAIVLGKVVQDTKCGENVDVAWVRVPDGVEKLNRLVNVHLEGIQGHGILVLWVLAHPLPQVIDRFVGLQLIRVTHPQIKEDIQIRWVSVVSIHHGRNRLLVIVVLGVDHAQHAPGLRNMHLLPNRSFKCQSSLRQEPVLVELLTKLKGVVGRLKRICVRDFVVPLLAH
mmetsp:Transcript_7025/g.20514  ORF Transcript_7025/g.20514 Transcript_7025/m.20514 type:complete len:273 (+) Transcript_7025:190-1008(+)